MNRKLRISVQTDKAVGASFHELAASEYYPLVGIDAFELVAYASHEEQIKALLRGETDEAFMAIDNTTSGRVMTTVAALRDADNVYINGVYVYKVDQHKIWYPGTDPTSAEIVYSMKPAIDQCMSAITSDGYEVCYATDTYGAAQELAQNMGYINQRQAVAIASRKAAELLSLDYDPTPYQNNKSNATKFWRIMPRRAHSQGHYVAFTIEVPDTMGSLRQAIEIISRKYGYNLTDIDSHLRPSQNLRRAFFVEVEVGADTDRIDELMMALESGGYQPHIMGKYDTLFSHSSKQAQSNISTHHHVLGDTGLWAGREPLAHPGGSLTMYVETNHRQGSLLSVLERLKDINLIDMGRPVAPKDSHFNRGFYFVLAVEQTDPRWKKARLNLIKDGHKVQITKGIK